MKFGFAELRLLRAVSNSPYPEVVIKGISYFQVQADDEYKIEITLYKNEIIPMYATLILRMRIKVDDTFAGSLIYEPLKHSEPKYVFTKSDILRDQDKCALKFTAATVSNAASQNPQFMRLGKVAIDIMIVKLIPRQHYFSTFESRNLPNQVEINYNENLGGQPSVFTSYGSTLSTNYRHEKNCYCQEIDPKPLVELEVGYNTSEYLELLKYYYYVGVHQSIETVEEIPYYIFKLSQPQIFPPTKRYP